MVAEANELAPNAEQLAVQPFEGASVASLELFLDHLMRAESNGRDLAANPRSTALGAFQFIKSTFISVAREHFTKEIAELSDEEVLDLRTNRHFARRAAAAYSRENAAYLSDQGIRPVFGHLRLAFLVGAGGAAKLLKAAPQTPVADVLSPASIRANPFMKGMTAADLIARSGRDIGGRGVVAVRTTAADATAASPDRGVRCNQALVSCRRWIALHAPKSDVRKTAGGRKTQAKGA